MHTPPPDAPLSATRMGVSGHLAGFFLTSPLTPLLGLLALLLGLFAVVMTPREEEPQINVTMANVFVPFPGASAKEVENLISIPGEQVLSRIAGVEHVYSVSKPGMAVITVQYKTGEDRTRALVNLYDTVLSKKGWLSPNLGAGEPIIKPIGIDDVPVMALTIWTEDETRGAFDLQHVAHALEAELKHIAGTREVATIGGPDDVVRVLLDADHLAAYGISAKDIRDTLQVANASQPAGSLVANNREILVQTGTFLESSADVKKLMIGVHDGNPVFITDVAQVVDGPDQPSRYVWFGTGKGNLGKDKTAQGEFPAVTLTLSKKPGENAVEIADRILHRMAQLRGSVIPEGVHFTVTRNYGVTASEKAHKLIGKLVFATSAVVLLALVALGRREALVVGIAVVLTLSATLFASWAWGFTLNRVSLFALIFSIGILVDDAIVVIENIHRQRTLNPQLPLSTLIPEAVDEVGGPTILATLTVIAALLPMAFVTGLMGPYMSPIPINSSFGMLISLGIAFTVTPWLSYKLLAGKTTYQHDNTLLRLEHLQPFFTRVIRPFLRGSAGAPKRKLLSLAIVLLIATSVSLALTQHVVLKMLPFDNKAEFQVVVDMPVGTPVEQTAHVLHEMGAYLASVPDVRNYQAYAGTASPINFNGLVRQYYLRNSPELGDLQVNLVDRSQRQRQSHEIARALRPPLEKIAARYGADLKIVEVPPGPPVLSPIAAEIYGPDYDGQMSVAKQVRAEFRKTPDVVFIDDSIEDNAEKLVLHVLQNKAALVGVSQQDIVETMKMGLGGEYVTPTHSPTAKYEVPVRISLPAERLNNLETLLKLRVRAKNNALVPLSELVKTQPATRDKTIYHKDLLPVVYVIGDMTGKLDSPLYGMFGIRNQTKNMALPEGGTLGETFIRQPDDIYAGYSLKWDGEWQITYETFRDMGAAYAVGLVLIYLLIVATFRSYLVPLIIMAPIPLTIIGVMPGHALLGEPFTATSMIGMIALAGIIVRNSILLVDFINQRMETGAEFQQAVISAAATRAKPILLTALAAMIGALFILDDPIFNGLAISLLFGIFVSTMLTLVVIPVLYYAVMWQRFINIPH